MSPNDSLMASVAPQARPVLPRKSEKEHPQATCARQTSALRPAARDQRPRSWARTDARPESASLPAEACSHEVRRASWIAMAIPCSSLCLQLWLRYNDPLGRCLGKKGSSFGVPWNRRHESGPACLLYALFESIGCFPLFQAIEIE